MSMLRIAEVFGHGVGNLGTSETRDRAERRCPFRNSPCTKSSKTDPLGICSLSNGAQATIICPVRFIEENRMFIDAGRIAFGTGVNIAPIPEVRVLRVNTKKIGKVDYLLAKLNENNEPVDFAALEVQAVYISGKSIRPAMRYFLQRQQLDENDCARRPDYRSSAQKRLMPQLSLKVPIFRRWGKKFFVAVDSLFFRELPEFPRVSAANSEITWLVYPFARAGEDYRIGSPEIVYSTWDDIAGALREGLAPEPEEIVEELRRQIRPARILSI